MEVVDNRSMNNIVILNAMNLTEYAFLEIYKGKTSVDFALETAGKMPGAVEKAVILPAGEYSGLFSGFRTISPSENSAAGLIASLVELSAGFDNIIYYSADCPLVDSELAASMYANHVKYFCEYTFADGYPSGTGVEIIKTTILSMLASLAEKEKEKSSRPIGRDTVFKLIETDINAFEVETEISPDDQRLLRVSLYPDSKRNYNQLREILAAVTASESTAKKSEIILETVRTRGEFLRSLPVFFEFETSGRHPQEPSYLPDSGFVLNRNSEMTAGDFSASLEKVKALSDDAVISLSVRNEPSAHSDPAALAEAVLSFDKFSLLIETSGIGWKDEILERILGMDQKRITWIIDLDALDRELYVSLRGVGYTEAYRFAEMMVERCPSNVWVQATRMKDNELDNEVFYKHWKQKTENIIIQKYDWYCGKLEQKKVTDLSPVKRLPCWKLKREMAVLTDGRVPLCREDLECGTVCGNIFTDDIEDIWRRGDDIYRRQLEEEYPGICRECDEYYTFNY